RPLVVALAVRHESAPNSDSGHPFAATRPAVGTLTSQTRPSRRSAPMSRPLGSSCHHARPCLAELGKAWWLLCQDSPNVSKESQALLVLRSPVRKGRPPNVWQMELTLQ